MICLHFVVSQASLGRSLKVFVGAFFSCFLTAPLWHRDGSKMSQDNAR